MPFQTQPLRPGAFLDSIVGFLLPYFIATAADIEAARSEIIDTLASYAVRTRAEVLMAAQILALGMTTLDTLREASTEDMSLSMRIRHRGNARNLNCAALQTEKALDQRLARDLPEMSPIQEPIPEQDANIDQVAAANEMGASVTARATNQLFESTQQERHRQVTALAMIEGLKQMGVPIQIIPGSMGSASPLA
jgi:hypothetical protein